MIHITSLRSAIQSVRHKIFHGGHIDQAGRTFDWDDTGYQQRTGWVGAQEGLLFIDRNPNGAADSGRELFSNGLVDDSVKGVRSIAWVDSNSDGFITANDPVFSQLKVWQDLDGDGRTGEFNAAQVFVPDPGELRSLSELGITALDYGTGRFTRNGQQFALGSPELTAEDEGFRVAPNPAGVRVEFSDGTARVIVTQTQSLGASNDLLPNVYEDGDSQPRATPLPYSIAASLLLQNDQASGGIASLTITAVGNAVHGTVRYDAANASVIFTPEANYNGDASFQYTVTDPTGAQKTATVSMVLQPVDEPPVALSLSAELAQVPIYGWAPLVRLVTTGSGDSFSTAPTYTWDQGEPIYAPYHTLAGGLLPQWIDVGEGGYWGEVGPTVDTGYLVGTEDAASTTYVIDTTRTFLHDTPVAYESANDGRIVLANPTAGVTYRYAIDPAKDGLYGTATINTATGEFTYTGNRYVEFDKAGNDVLGNIDTDAHARGEEVFMDVFTVDVYDANAPEGSAPIGSKDIAVPHYGPRPDPNVASGGKKPIALDLNGDGFHFTDVNDSNVFMDVNGDGWRRRIAWLGADDGLLAYDQNGNGKVDSYDEIAYVPHARSGQTDLESLRLAFDSNHDGVFSAADRDWAKFGVWQDANQNGVTDAGEFKGLDAMGIVSISLTSDGHFQVIDGQTVHGQTVATRTDGSTLTVADVTLNVSNVAQGKNPDGSDQLVKLPTQQSGQHLDGTDGTDLIMGTNGSDTFRAGVGDDIIMDDGGNDAVEAGAGKDMVYTGVGNDFADAGAGDDQVYAGTGNDIVMGGDGNDLLVAEDGNDIVFGGAGHDFVSGGLGNDVLSGDAGDDRLFGEAGADALFGQDGDDELYGMGGADQLFGQGGNDLLSGGAGHDTLEGGGGDDTYEVDSLGDTIIELTHAGDDTVRASIDYRLDVHLESLVLTGSAALNGTGNTADNALHGNEAANTLSGLEGNDLLDGGMGADTLIGGQGDDTYRVNETGDQVVEQAGEGADTVESLVSCTLGSEVENLTLLGLGQTDATGNAANNVLRGNASANTLDGGLGADSLMGGRGNDRYQVDDQGDVVTEFTGEGADSVVSSLFDYTLADNVETLILLAGTTAVNGTGNTLDNTLIGNAANNRLDGGSGADVMAGGVGDDRYVVDNTADSVDETTGEGMDLILASVSYKAAAAVENLTLTGSAAIDGTGNTLNNVLTGNDANNALFGLDGNDQLIGAGGHDTLDGGSGADTLAGGAGDDHYVVDNAADSIIEATGEGTDLILSSVSYTAAAAVENLSLTGSAAIDGTGNALNNVLTGNEASNVLLGLNGNDQLIGAEGHDTLDGGTGADEMAGGTGNDQYMVDAAGDQVTELVSEGFDRVTASLDYTLTAHVEQLVLVGSAVRGTGNTLSNLLIGNDLANVLDGQSGADRMAGGAGDDRYIVDNMMDAVFENATGGVDTVYASVSATTAPNIEHLLLTGSADLSGAGNALNNVLVGNVGANILIGGDGADVLAGGVGNDRLDGGTGNDVYLYNQGEGRDTLVDAFGQDTLRFGAGITLNSVAARKVTVAGQCRMSISLLDTDGQETAQGIEITLGAEGSPMIETVQFTNSRTVSFEQLMITTRLLNGTRGDDLLFGDRRDDMINGSSGADTVYARSGNDTVYGGGQDDKLFGEGGNDRLHGELNDDQLWGGAGADWLDGGLGQDVLIGGTGNDTLRGDLGDDVLDGGAGHDHLEGGLGDDSLYGGEGDDQLTGNRGSDVLAAGAGDDVLNGGGAGWDVIVAGTGHDVISTVGSTALIDAGAGNDIITAGRGYDFIAAGQGNDTINTGGASDLVAFNRGDGADTVTMTGVSGSTLSLGGGIRYADMSLQKRGTDLVLNLGQGDSVTLAGWYVPARERPPRQSGIDTLQVVTVGGDYTATSTQRLLNHKVVDLEFRNLVKAFDQALAKNPSLTHWSISLADLDGVYESGTNDHAKGGDLAFRYATTGSYGDLSATDVQQRLATLCFSGSSALKTSTTVDPWTALQAGVSLTVDQTVGLPSPIVPMSTLDDAALALLAMNTSGAAKPGWVGTQRP